MPVASLCRLGYLQNGHFCLFLCLSSTLFSLAFTTVPYLKPNLPECDIFFVAILIFIKYKLADSMGMPGFEPGPRTPKARILTKLDYIPNLKMGDISFINLIILLIIFWQAFSHLLLQAMRMLLLLLLQPVLLCLLPELLLEQERLLLLQLLLLLLLPLPSLAFHPAYF